MNRAFKYVVVGVSSILVALILAGSLVGQSQPVSEDPAAPYRHLSVYAEVFAKIKSDYVEEPDMKNVTLGAINGLLISIDPFASYLNADQYKQYTKAKELKRAAVGLVLSRKYGYEINVVDAILGSPADKAGISTGDIVESINGIQTRDMPLAFADLLLEGDPGTTVDLTVLRLRKPDPVTIKLTRAEIKSPPIVVRMADNQTGLVQVYDLSAGKAAQVAAAVKEIEKRGAKRLILDLRHDAVSADEEGIALANLFLGKGTIATLQGQTMPKQSFEADPAKVIFSGPMVVLTNRGTLGAAEIAAAALEDNKRAEVVGERTFGDAAVRKVIRTEDGGAVLLAVAKYYSPLGKAFQETPVVPEFLVNDIEGQPLEEEDVEPDQQAAPPARKPGEDPVLKKALDVLNGVAPVTAARSGAQPVTAPVPVAPTPESVKEQADPGKKKLP
ncbi:MAG: S41 family peptidase [Bryobacteraceae bacterium]|jgi:carboxyl-terminal processing protease